MPRPARIALTDGELRLMQVLWDRGRATVGEVVDGLRGRRKPAYNTVLTMMRILEKKGYVTHEKAGRAFVFIPRIDRDQARRSAISRLLGGLFDNSPSLLVLNLLEAGDVTPEELDRVRDLLDRGGAEPGRRR